MGQFKDYDAERFYELKEHCAIYAGEIFRLTGKTVTYELDRSGVQMGLNPSWTVTIKGNNTFNVSVSERYKHICEKESPWYLYMELIDVLKGMYSLAKSIKQ